MDKYIIIGLGVFGRQLALNLMEKGAEVVAVDSNMDFVEEVKDQVTYAVKLDSTDEKALDSLGLEDFDVGVVCIGENFEANLLTSVLLKQKGVKKVIARATDPIHIKVLKAVGIDQIVSPEAEAAAKLSYSLIYKSLLDVAYIGEKTAAFKIEAPDSFVGKTIGELNLRAKYHLNVVAIHKMVEVEGKGGPIYQEKVVTKYPDAYTVIYKNDILVVICESKDFQEFSNQFKSMG